MVRHGNGYSMDQVGWKVHCTTPPPASVLLCWSAPKKISARYMMALNNLDAQNSIWNHKNTMAQYRDTI